MSAALAAAEAERIAQEALAAGEAGWAGLCAALRDERSAPQLEALAQALKLHVFDTRLHTDLDAALLLARFIHTLGEACGLPGVVGLGLLAEGDAARQGGRAVEAMALFDDAGALFLRAGDDIGWARARGGWLIAATHAGQVTTGDLAAMDRVCDALRAQGLTYRLAMVEQNMAIAFQYLARYDAALAICDRALAAVAAGQDRPERNLRAMLLGNKANILLWLGDLRAARALHQQARELFADIENTGLVALADMNLAVIERLRWNLHDALRLTVAGVEGFQRTGQQHFVALGLMHRADLLLLLNRADEAVAAADEAVAMLRALQFPVDLADALYTHSRAHLLAGGDEMALASLSEAEAVMARTPEQHGMYPIAVARATLLLAQGRPGEAKEVALAMLHAPVTSDTALHRGMARLITAESLLALDQRAAARALAQAILAEAERWATPELVYRAHVVLARAARADGDMAQALAQYDRAVASLGYVLDELVYDQRAEFLQDKDALYLEALALALDSGNPTRALLYLERARERARWMIRARPRPAASGPDTPPMGPSAPDELDELDELDATRARHRYISASLATLPADAPAAVGATRELRRLTQRIRDLLEARAEQTAGSAGLDETTLTSALERAGTVVAYALVGHDLVSFVSDGRAIRAHRSPGAARELGRLERLLQLTVDTLAGQCVGTADALGARAEVSRRWGAPLGQVLASLWQLLIAPFERLLPDDGAPLTLVPHGLLHTLPLAALYDGQRYLVERWPVRCVPSCLALRPAPADEWVGNAALALGYGGEGALPAAGEEARQVARLLGGAAWVEDEATGERLCQASQRWDVLHLATHAALRQDNPNASFIQLADGPFHPSDVLTLDLRGCRLVTLSACRTALGRRSGGDEQIGLTTAFARAGAEAVLAALWRIDDAATLEVMRALYQRMAAGAEPADALRAAQLACLHANDDAALTHPYFWSGFQLSLHRTSVPAGSARA